MPITERALQTGEHIIAHPGNDADVLWLQELVLLRLCHISQFHR